MDTPRRAELGAALKVVFIIDVQIYSFIGSAMLIITCTEVPGVIVKILTGLNVKGG